MPTRPSQHPFDALVQRDATEIRLAEAALLFPIDHCRDVRIASWLNRLDDLARRVDLKEGEANGFDSIPRGIYWASRAPRHVQLC